MSDDDLTFHLILKMLTFLSEDPDPQTWQLEVMKEGCLISQIHLQHKLYTLGRQAPSDQEEDPAFLVLEHPSLSRVHALLAFDAANQRWLIQDMQSTHGTFVNRKQLSALNFVPLEQGDIINFGFSTRSYTVSEWQEPNQSFGSEEEQPWDEGVQWGMDYQADEQVNRFQA